MEDVLNNIRCLGNEDYRDLMIQAFDSNRPAVIQKAIVTGIRKRGSRNCSRRGGEPKEESGVDAKGTLLSWPSLPWESSRSAWKVPFVYRGDLIPENGHVFYDVEKLTVKTEGKVHEQVGSCIAVVNEQKDLIFWSFIKPEKEVCQYFKSITGIDKMKLEIGLPLQIVLFFVNLCFQGNTIVGYDMENDLKCIGQPTITSKDDLSEYFFEKKSAPNSNKAIQEKYSLKDLNYHFFKTDIQCSLHSAIIDARTTRDLWFKKKELIVTQPVFLETVARSTKKSFVFDKTDVCKCSNTKANKKRTNPLYFAN